MRSAMDDIFGALFQLEIIYKNNYRYVKHYILGKPVMSWKKPTLAVMFDFWDERRELPIK